MAKECTGKMSRNGTLPFRRGDLEERDFDRRVLKEWLERTRCNLRLLLSSFYYVRGRSFEESASPSGTDPERLVNISRLTPGASSNPASETWS